MKRKLHKAIAISAAITLTGHPMPIAASTEQPAEEQVMEAGTTVQTPTPTPTPVPEVVFMDGIAAIPAAEDPISGLFTAGEDVPLFTSGEETPFTGTAENVLFAGQDSVQDVQALGQEPIPEAVPEQIQEEMVQEPVIILIPNQDTIGLEGRPAEDAGYTDAGAIMLTDGNAGPVQPLPVDVNEDDENTNQEEPDIADDEKKDTEDDKDENEADDSDKEEQDIEEDEEKEKQDIEEDEEKDKASKDDREEETGEEEQEPEPEPEPELEPETEEEKPSDMTDETENFVQEEDNGTDFPMPDSTDDVPSGPAVFSSDEEPELFLPDGASLPDAQAIWNGDIPLFTDGEYTAPEEPDVRTEEPLDAAPEAAEENILVVPGQEPEEQQVQQTVPAVISNLHAGNGFYVNSLANLYGISFDGDIAQELAEIELDYLYKKGFLREDGTVIFGTDDPAYGREQHPSAETYSAYAKQLVDGRYMPEGLLSRNWQDVIAIYIYEKYKAGDMDFTINEGSRQRLSEIFEMLNPVIIDGVTPRYGNYHINTYIRNNNITGDDRAFIESYTDTDCKLLCATITAARGIVRQSAGDDVAEDRIGVVTAAYSLVGKIGYFWGGKSNALGFDPAWGTGAVVTAEGSSTSGTARALGLDCSGFVTWAVINGFMNQNAEGLIGHGTTDQWINCGVVSEDNAQPGDLVFQRGPEAGSDNHVGILAGKTAQGDWIAVHCTSGVNGVTVGEAYSAGFRYIRTPSFYMPKPEPLDILKATPAADSADTAVPEFVQEKETGDTNQALFDDYVESGALDIIVM